MRQDDAHSGALASPRRKILNRRNGPSPPTVACPEDFSGSLPRTTQVSADGSRCIRPCGRDKGPAVVAGFSLRWWRGCGNPQATRHKRVYGAEDGKLLSRLNTPAPAARQLSRAAAKLHRAPAALFYRPAASSASSPTNAALPDVPTYSLHGLRGSAAIHPTFRQLSPRFSMCHVLPPSLDFSSPGGRA